MLENNHIEEILTLAADLEPDYENWTYGQHSWCIDTKEEVEAYLKKEGIPFKKKVFLGGLECGFFGPKKMYHSWITLEDETIIDPTVKQFFLPEKNFCLCAGSCSLCTPLLDQQLFRNSDFWIVEKSSPLYSFYSLKEF